MLVRICDYFESYMTEATNVMLSVSAIPFSQIEQRATNNYNHNIAIRFMLGNLNYSISIPIIVGSDVCQTAYMGADKNVDEGYILMNSGSKLIFKNKELITNYGIKVLKEDRAKSTTNKGDLTVEYSQIDNHSDEVTKYQLVVTNCGAKSDPNAETSGVMLVVSYSKRGQYKNDVPTKYSTDILDFYSIVLRKSHKTLDETRNYLRNKCPNISFGKVHCSASNNRPHTNADLDKLHHIVDMLLVSLNSNIVQPQVMDLDSYANKIILTPGHIMFRHISTILRKIKSGESKTQTIFHTNGAFQSHIDDKLLLTHETEIKSMAQTRTTCVNVSQYGATIIRSINLSQVGNICLYYTPESADVGLKKELALYAAVSMYRSFSVEAVMSGYDPSQMITTGSVAPPGFKLMIHRDSRYFVTPEFFAELRRRVKTNINFFDLTMLDLVSSYMVISNGAVIGHFAYVVRDGKINKLDEIENYDETDIHAPRKVVAQALKDGHIEFITAMEQYREVLQPHEINETTTHCMISPSAIFGSLALSVPFTNYNYGVRVSYNSNMCKSAIDTSRVNTLNTKCKKLDEGEKGIVMTSFWNYCYPNVKNLKNLFVMICVQHNNNEDAIIMSKSTAKNKFRYTMYSYKRVRLSNKAVLESGPEVYGLEGGLPIVGRYYTNDEPIISYRRHGDNFITTENTSLESYGTLVSVLREGNGAYLMSFSEKREYICGDKLCARYSQKGVVSELVDIPKVTGGIFEGSDIHPDIILSPFVIPTRMTMGLIMEMKAATYIVAKAFYEHGRITYETLVGAIGENLAATCKLSDNPNQIIKTSNDPLPEISKHYTMYADAFEDYSALEDVNIYNYVDGKRVIVAPVAYMLLRHHTIDKIKFSEFNPETRHTDLIMKGERGRRSGLKIGLQEVLALYSIGATSMLSDLSRTTQNNVRINSCVSCGKISIEHTSLKCQYCLGTMKPVIVPYAFVLVYRIMMTQNNMFKIWPKITGETSKLVYRM